MDEFVKSKVAFAVALLAALFTTEPFLEGLSGSFIFFGYELGIREAYVVMAATLGLSVYSYGIQFLTETPWKPIRIAGDYLYAIALATPVFFLLLYVSTVVATGIGRFAESDLANKVSTLALGAAAGWLSARLARKFRALSEEKEQAAAVREFAREEDETFSKARTLVRQGHYDMAAIEALRSVEAGLRKALRERGHRVPERMGMRQLIGLSHELGLLPETQAVELDQLREARNLAAHSVEPVSGEDARELVSIASRVLNTIEAAQEEDE